VAGGPHPPDANPIARREPRLTGRAERLDLADRTKRSRRLSQVGPRGRLLASAQPLDPRVDLARRDRPLADEPLLGAESQRS